MSLTTLLLLGAAYLFLVKPAYEQVRTTGGVIPPATAQIRPDATRITIPGVGDYTNIGGGGVSISLNPNLFAGLFGAGTAAPQPVATAPAPADYGYLPQPADDPTYYGWV